MSDEGRRIEQRLFSLKKRKGVTQGKMIAVSKHLEGNHREEGWHFLCVRPEGRASPIVWAGVQRGGYPLIGRSCPGSLEYLCPVTSSHGGHAMAYW